MYALCQANRRLSPRSYLTNRVYDTEGFVDQICRLLSGTDKREAVSPEEMQKVHAGQLCGETNTYVFLTSCDLRSEASLLEYDIPYLLNRMPPTCIILDPPTMLTTEEIKKLYSRFVTQTFASIQNAAYTTAVWIYFCPHVDPTIEDDVRIFFDDQDYQEEVQHVRMCGHHTHTHCIQKSLIPSHSALPGHDRRAARCPQNPAT